MSAAVRDAPHCTSTRDSGSVQHMDEAAKNLRLSVVLEWENIHNYGDSRAREMLRRLKVQGEQLLDSPAAGDDERTTRYLGRFEAPIEVIVAADEEEIAPLARSAVIEELGENNPVFEVTTVVVEEGRYLDLKHAGARASSGDVILFLDSDILPEEGWLKTLIGSLAQPDVRVVGSKVYVDPVDLVHRTFALTWYFALRAEESRLERRFRLHANSTAYGREVYERFPWPDLPAGYNRAPGPFLWPRMEEAGVPRWVNTGARASHPAPSNFSHFVRRALMAGKDESLIHKGLWAPFRIWAGNVLSGAARILRHHGEVGLRLTDVPVALVLMSGYYSLALMGGIAARIRPGRRPDSPEGVRQPVRARAR